ncbi:aspartate/glutamate racemase family protein (plasmid) [Agrobacterium tumefaciens]|uniref:aspartate/glutamate racemase family protein n=2 Tax=Agrobacterium tumefaciens TaxID=358 RepID=UPI0021D027C6|nr:aspartate/glutamate racemase family protein [Agrobacterium tumefaciens]NTZ64187.1 aspartate/glutamate racemase family protein [Agrobacterium tumefaciens]UXT00170.1 aspartate/glutamate racemase family protein [Agrobacterium tumefaciens]UXT52979.1 aspartate/glutamate racemase family protein [Agrobacterium tumefaciens]UXT69000.1 aspartate/glutamate racemase family protein [Agrobacterium tumefaciens]
MAGEPGGSPPKGKKSFYGVTIGILMVETYFRRFVGDIGNAETWPFPVQYKIVRGALPSMMGNLQNCDLLEPFKKAAQELIDGGVDGITTTCGFLSYYQRELAEACSVPVATSALLQAPLVERLLPKGKRVGILTYSSDNLTSAYLEAVGVDPGTPVYGMPPASEFCRSIRDGDPSVPYEVWEREILDATAGFLKQYPDIGAIVCECTNMTPFSAAISDRFNIPVYDSVSLVHWFHSGLRPKHYRPR